VAVRESNAWHIRFVDVVPARTGQIPMLTEPMSFELHLEAGLDDTVASELGEGRLRELVDLHLGLAKTPTRCKQDTRMSGNTVLLEQRLLHVDERGRFLG
jgi:hypothetical protein